MASVAIGLATTAIGLVVKKSRDEIAKKFKGGDVAEEAFRKWIMTETNAVSLDGLTRKDLNTSITYFREGVVYLFKELCITNNGQENDNEVVNIDEVLTNPNLAGFIHSNQSCSPGLKTAKKSFKEAHKTATAAYSTDTLRTSGRIRAMAIRVGARILENVDNPKNALEGCKMYLADLHDMPEVQKNFKVALKGGIRAHIGRNERREIISDVCHVNRAVHDLMQIVCQFQDLQKLHCVDIGKEKVDPLRDVRVTTILLKPYKHCRITPWPLDPYKVNMPRGITTNTRGQFIVGDQKDLSVKVFNRSGKFQKCFCLPFSDQNKFKMKDVATDGGNNVYVLVRVNTPTGRAQRYDAVYVFRDMGSDQHYADFSLEKEFIGHTLTIDDHNKKVLVLRKNSAKSVVDVYETHGRFVRRFGQDVLKDPSDITATNDGHIVVVDKFDSHVYVFNEQGKQLYDFEIKGLYFSLNIAPYLPCNQHVVVAGKEKSKNSQLHMLIYTVEGQFVRSLRIGGQEIDSLAAITVNKEGRFAVVFRRSKDSQAEEVCVV